MVGERTSIDHDEIFEMLPDYAVGDLSDGDLWRAATHVETCAVCQRELSFLLETISLLAPAPIPPAARKVVVGTQRPRTVTGVTPMVAPQAPGKVLQFPLVPLALIAAAIVIIASVAVWRVVLDQDETEQEVIAHLLLDPSASHPINDSELNVGAGGAMFTDPDSSVAYLVASGLPEPGPDEAYQVWLFTESGQRISAGMIDIEADGVGQVVVHAPDAFSTYWAVGVSLEPKGGSDAPTSPLVVGGWLQ